MSKAIGTKRRGKEINMEPSWSVDFADIDVMELDDKIIIRALLPGIHKKDIDISLTNDTVALKIYAAHEAKEENEEENNDLADIDHGEFTRYIVLSAAVDGDKAKATYNYGILELVLPKAEASVRRTILVE